MLDERWLQGKINEDPTILGLGKNVTVIGRERIQPSRGRLDFLLWDPEKEMRYEVEVMLGRLDESHIIRTIEYWDIERQRFPSYEHRAVIVAEEVTARFFNVIRLLNRSIPIIALQLNAFTFEGGMGLQFVKVLDVLGEVEVDEDDGGGQISREVWEKKASADALAAMDSFIALAKETLGSVRVTYNKHHIALGAKGNNFCWFHPGKGTKHCHSRIRVDADVRDSMVEKLSETELYVRPFGERQITLKIARRDVQEHKDLLESLLLVAEEDAERI